MNKADRNSMQFIALASGGHSVQDGNVNGKKNKTKRKTVERKKELMTSTQVTGKRPVKVAPELMTSTQVTGKRPVKVAPELMTSTQVTGKRPVKVAPELMTSTLHPRPQNTLTWCWPRQSLTLPFCK